MPRAVLQFKEVMPYLRRPYKSVVVWGFPGGSEGKVSACNAGDLGLIPRSGRSPEEGNGNPLQYSCLKIPWTEKPGRLQSMGSQRVDTTERLHCHLGLLQELERKGVKENLFHLGGGNTGILKIFLQMAYILLFFGHISQ